MSVTGQRVLVTGGSSGIGAATAGLLAAGGAHVAVLARDPAKLHDVADGIGAVAVPADLRDPDQTRAAVIRAADRLGGLDAIVNNAGVFPLSLVASAVVEDWTAMLEVNLRGLLVATQAAIPHLRASTRGQIVNISSMGGRRVASAAQGTYAGTKHAVHAISEGLRRELFADGIRVTVIAPGFVRTNLGAGIRDPDQREAMHAGQTRAGLEPEHVAAQIVHVLGAPPSIAFVEIALVSADQTPV